MTNSPYIYSSLVVVVLKFVNSLGSKTIINITAYEGQNWTER